MAILILVLITSLGIVYAAWKLQNNNNGFEKSFPCVGLQEGQWFAWSRAKLRSFTMTEEWMKEGYEKYSRKNQAFTIPSFGKGKVLILPPSQIKTVYNKRESELEAHAPASESLSFEYTIRDPAVYPSDYTVDVVRKWITKRFDELTAELQEELFLAVDEQFGLGDEWRDVQLWIAVQRVFAGGLNRVLVGFPLCRDPTYLETVRRFAMDMPLQGLFTTLIPKLLKPIFGPLMCRHVRRDTQKGIAACLPLIRARLSDHQKRVENETSREKQPVGILEWIIEASAATGDPAQLNPYRIGHRVMILNFNFVQSGSIPFSTALSDICSGPNAASTFSRLRDEAEAVLSTVDNWNRATISELTLADSAIRESMRWSDFGLFVLPRRVNSIGITLDNGIYLPPGVHVEMPMHFIHSDETFYEDAGSFKPFRFADGTSAARSAVSLDETFLGFGYGRNACPGRFLGIHITYMISECLRQASVSDKRVSQQTSIHKM
ncbi:ent-kaurene oxidase [Fusarium langsethiae]|uniref:Ent-kaurene oxidase n=1 Tax=Fusarium langsethiae TaxID=179993 RepID=A0A0M9ELU9_FUSLA|nr:ent-kaurene oxidase [Fusarium langsethiae]